jgi:hypothetical protein
MCGAPCRGSKCGICRGEAIFGTARGDEKCGCGIDRIGGAAKRGMDCGAEKWGCGAATGGAGLATGAAGAAAAGPGFFCSCAFAAMDNNGAVANARTTPNIATRNIDRFLPSRPKFNARSSRKFR